MSNTAPRVSFTEMKAGTPEDFRLIASNDLEFAKSLPSKIISHLRTFADDDGAYQISRLDHCLQCATRAMKDEADDEWIAAALLHDIGDILAPFAHAEASYAILKPFVREEIGWVVRHHGIFQRYYNCSLAEEERNSKFRLKDHPYFSAAEHFCEHWDQCSFDPNYDTYAIERFIPVIERVFGEIKYHY